MKSYRVRPGGALRGHARVPGDKSIGHRALIFASLAEGPCTVRGLSEGLDNRATAEAFRSMGVELRRDGDTAQVSGVGLRGLGMPTGGAIDCGNSGTTMRLLAGLLAGQRFGTRLHGDDSLTRRPMRRIVEPLRARGAHIAGAAGKDPDEIHPPLSIAPLVESEALVGLEYEMPTASAQVKSALLLSGLYAEGITALREPTLSRDHTERMMLSLGVPLETVGPMVVLDPEGWRRGWDGFDWTVPGDPSSAAFLVCAAAMVEGSDLVVEGVGTNPTRTGLLDVLRSMRVEVAAVPKGDGAGGEPVSDLHASHARPQGTLVGDELLVRMIDEVPALAALGAVARGRTEIRDAGELRVKESDRIATMAATLRAFGASCEELEDGLVVHGGGALRGARVASHGDHRVAMAAVLLGLAAEGETVVEDVACVETSFPGFAEQMRALGADVTEIADDPASEASLGREASGGVEGGAVPKARLRREQGVPRAARRTLRQGGEAPLPVVAIDGPAGAGKSTAARRLAARLGWVLVDTGALYRAVALAARERGVARDDGPALGRLAGELDIAFEPGPEGRPRVFVDGRDRSEDIRTPEVSQGASDVSKLPEVREALLEQQRALGRDGGVVLEGRDIGTVVFPDAEVKVFLTASAEVRAERRVDELRGKGSAADYDETLQQIRARDAQDAGREVAPLRQADDAVLLDTSELDADQVLDRLVGIVHEETGISPS